jgi:integration host factor subunit beta
MVLCKHLIYKGLRKWEKQMTKSELVKKLMEANDNLYLKDVRLLVDTIFDEMSDALARGDRIELRGFGAFSIRKRKPRIARNPKTNDTVQLGERSVVYFRAGKGLREKVNDGGTTAGTPTSFTGGNEGGATDPSPFSNPY